MTDPIDLRGGHFLKPGGRLFFADGHPAALVFDGDDGPGGMPTFQYAYAKAGPDVIEDDSDDADPEARLPHARTWEWMHPLGEVFGALREAGLAIDEFTEHYEVPWQPFSVTEPKGDGMFGWPAEQWPPPSYELVASAPASAPGS
ncbi:hypothetical protein [Agromyces sp. NPDC049794]|uniref:hypothetical protein n=1 Tax=unclassified Agromyces TaxID=2639701 RepID=UPI0034001A84